MSGPDQSIQRRWWVPLVTIAGAMLATFDASIHERWGNDGSARGRGITAGRLIATIDGLPGLDRGQGETIDQITEPEAEEHVCSRARTADCGFHARSLTAAAAEHNHTVAKGPRVGVATTVRVVCHSRVRVTRLQNGTILCSRNLPPGHILVMPADANDDTASDGNDTSDDDDSWDDVNGDDDTESSVIAWLKATVFSGVAPECPPVSPRVAPSFAPSLTTLQQHLRC